MDSVMDALQQIVESVYTAKIRGVLVRVEPIMLFYSILHFLSISPVIPPSNPHYSLNISKNFHVHSYNKPF